MSKKHAKEQTLNVFDHKLAQDKQVKSLTEAKIEKSLTAFHEAMNKENFVTEHNNCQYALTEEAIETLNDKYLL